MKQYFFLLLSVAIFVNGCIDPPEYPDEPVLEFVSVSSQSIVAQTTPRTDNRQTDTLYIVFSFTDGDGDLDLDASTNMPNVFVKDSRTGTEEPFKVPTIPDQGVNNGISGEITLRFDELFCFPNSPPTDKVTFTIRVVDKAGHRSGRNHADL